MNLERYSKDDMDLLLYNVCNSTKANVILYEVHRITEMSFEQNVTRQGY